MAGDQQLILGKNKNYAIQQKSIDLYAAMRKYFSAACFDKTKELFK